MLPELCALLGYYAAYVGNSLPTFREKPNGPIFNSQAVSSVKQPKTARRLKMGLISCPETSVTNYHSMLRKTQKSSHLIQMVADTCKHALAFHLYINSVQVTVDK